MQHMIHSNYKKICPKVAYIGIDQSLNSTGITIRRTVNGEEQIKFFIIKPYTHEILKSGKEKSPLTNKEQKAQDRYKDRFEYVLYDKTVAAKDLDAISVEHIKTMNFIKIVDTIHSIITDNTDGCDYVYVCMEGVSYGSSIRSSYVFDLAGLNYMIRSMLFNDKRCDTYIATPGAIKKFATGFGNANKDLMVEVFSRVFPHFDLPKLDDIADSYFMSRLAQRLHEDRDDI